MQDLPVPLSESESSPLTLGERFKAFNRQLASKCFSLGGVAVISFVLLFAAEQCNDDGGDDGGGGDPPPTQDDGNSGDDGNDGNSGDDGPGCDPPEDDDSGDDSDTGDGDSGGDSGDDSDDDSDLWEDSIFLEPRDKLQEEGVTSIPADPTKDTDKDVVTAIISEFDDTDGFKPKAAQDKLDELLGSDYEKGDPISREVLAEVMCAGLSCSGSDTDARINELYDMGITVGRYEHDGTDEGKTNAFAGDETGSNGHVVAFFGRIKDLIDSNSDIVDPGYHPPVYVAPPPSTGGPTPACDSGYVVIAAHVNADDDGCRPPSCDFGRGADGWCLRPTTGDTPLLYLVGGGDIDEDGGSVGFKIVSTHPLPKPITVTVDTTDGTAVGGSDYTTVSRTVTIPADTTFSFVFVPVLDDSISESDETFALSMSSPTNADLSTTTQSDVTIIDDELPTPENVQLVCAGDSAPFTLTATWEGTPTGPLAGADENVWFGRVNPDGRQSLVGWDMSPSGHTATTTVSQEARYGVAVEWEVGSGPDALRSRGVATTTCGDVLDLLTVTCSSSSSGTIPLGINWDASLGAQDVRLHVSSSSNPAITDEFSHTYDDLAEGSTVTSFDWRTLTGVTFSDMRDTTHAQLSAAAAHPTTYEFSLPNQPDVADVSITIPGSSGDLASVCPEPPSVSVADTTANEGDGVARFTVSLSAASPHLVTVEVDTSNGTGTAAATEPDDYTAIASRTVTFLPNQRTATVSVAIIDDSITEPDESFTVMLSNPVNATLGTATATGTITDDDTGSSNDGWSL